MRSDAKGLRVVKATGAVGEPLGHAPTPAVGRHEVRVTFDDTGTHVLRCLASDEAVGTSRSKLVR